MQGRFSNAPGYPLYTMGGWLWFFTRAACSSAPTPTPSASCPATPPSGRSSRSALLVTGSACSSPRTTADPTGLRTGRRVQSLLVTGFYGLTYFFWYYAVTTEQYTSSVAWTLAVVLLAFLWENKRRDAYLLALALLTGIGLAHQVTVLGNPPPLLWFVLSAEPRLLRRGQFIPALLPLVLLPLLSYIFVYVAARSAQSGTARASGKHLGLVPELPLHPPGPRRAHLVSRPRLLTAEFPSIIWREMTWPGLLAGRTGIAALGRRRALLLYATILIYAAFCWIDRLGNRRNACADLVRPGYRASSRPCAVDA